MLRANAKQASLPVFWDQLLRGDTQTGLADLSQVWESKVRWESLAVLSPYALSGVNPTNSVDAVSYQFFTIFASSLASEYGGNTLMATGYAEAFKKLGYVIHAPRSDVSAEKSGGIALAIMRHELDRKAMIFDSRQVEDWDKERKHRPGNSRRIVHLQRCLEQFGGRVDVIIVDKRSKDEFDGAEPWMRSGSYWKVTYFDHSTGHHRVELKRE